MSEITGKSEDRRNIDNRTRNGSQGVIAERAFSTKNNRSARTIAVIRTIVVAVGKQRRCDKKRFGSTVLAVHHLQGWRRACWPRRRPRPCVSPWSAPRWQAPRVCNTPIATSLTWLCSSNACLPSFSLILSFFLIFYHFHTHIHTHTHARTRAHTGRHRSVLDEASNSIIRNKVEFLIRNFIRNEYFRKDWYCIQDRISSVLGNWLASYSKLRLSIYCSSFKIEILW